MIVVGLVSLQCFSEKVVIVTPEATPAESHDANQVAWMVKIQGKTFEVLGPSWSMLRSVLHARGHTT